MILGELDISISLVQKLEGDGSIVQSIIEEPKKQVKIKDSNLLQPQTKVGGNCRIF